MTSRRAWSIWRWQRASRAQSSTEACCSKMVGSLQGSSLGILML